MTTPTLAEALRGWNSFNASCSQLLMHADMWLSNQPPRLQQAAGKNCLPSGGSGAVDSPNGWWPSVITRVYQHPGDERVFAWVGILLAMREPKAGWSDRGQPLVTAGYVRATAGSPKVPSLLVSKALWRSQDVPINGTLHAAKWDGVATALPKGEPFVLGLPLEEIRTSQDLERRVLEPLVQAIQTPTG